MIGFQSTHRVSDATVEKFELWNKKRFQSTHRVSDATEEPLSVPF